MKDPKNPTDVSPKIEALYPKLSSQELHEAEENLDRYIELALRIYERVRLDPEARADLRNLTGFQPDPTMEEKGRTNCSLNLQNK